MVFKKRGIVNCLIVLGACFYTPLLLATEVPVIDESIRMESDGKTQSAAEVRGGADDNAAYDKEDADDSGGVTQKSIRSLSLEQRITRLEKQVGTHSQVDVSTQVEELKQDVTDLRGQIEETTHQVRQALQKAGVGAAKTAAVAAAPATVTAAKATPEASQAAADPEELQTYQKGYDAIKAKDFNGAKSAFQDYLQDYDQGAYAGNAHYWLGEIYLHQTSLSKAAAEFSQVITNPKSPKYPDAMLKLGFVYYQQQNWNQARKQLNLVTQQFPNTTVASLASARLQDMTQQGH